MTQTTTSTSPGGGLLARPLYRTELLDHLREEWRPVFRDIAAGAVQRELDGALPFEAVRRLKDDGFGALRVPRAYGGRGATWPELTALWIELAAADANLPQAFRGHFALAEDRLWQHAPRARPARCGSTGSSPARSPATPGRRSVGTAIDTQQTVLRPAGRRPTG